MKQNNEPKLYTMSRNAQTIMAHTDGEGYPVVQGELAGFVSNVTAAGGALVVSNYHNAYETALETQLDTYLGFSKDQGLKPAIAGHTSVFTTIGTTIGVTPADVAEALLNEAMAISSETSAARSNEAIISDALSTEVNVRSTADVAISDALVAEEGVRSTADKAISDALVAEEGVRSTGDSTISNAVVSEVLVARSAEDDLSTQIANLRGSSLDKVYDVVSQYVTASAVEAYRTRLWLSEIDRFLNVMKANISVEPSAQTYDGGSVLSAAVIANRLNSVSGTVLSGVALDFGLNDALLSNITAGDYTVSTGLNTGVGVINTTKDTVGNYQQLFSQSG